MSSDKARWSATVAFTVLGLLIVIAGTVYVESISSMVGIWQRTDAFRHNFLVFPLSALMVWRRRRILRQIAPVPSAAGAAMLLSTSVLWWLGTRLDAQILTHLAVVVVVPASVVATFGLQVASVLRFPLAFLLFAVPAGEFLIPWLIDFTAGFSVASLNLLGVPVYQDGRFFYIPTGSYEVAKACSGLKYVIATLMIAVLVGHWFFVRMQKILLFAVIAVAAAIIANGLRATVVVLLLHYTNLDIADGPDHLFVGWIIYAGLVALLIWVAVRLEDPGEAPRPIVHQAAPSRFHGMKIAALSITCVLTGPVLDAQTRPIDSPGGRSQASIPSAYPRWTLITSFEPGWVPEFNGIRDSVSASYLRDDERIDVAIVEFQRQARSHHLAGAVSRVADSHEWSMREKASVVIETGRGSIIARQIDVMRGRHKRLVWYWRKINGIVVNDSLRSKLAKPRRIMRNGQGTAIVTMASTSAEDVADDAGKPFRRFVTVFYGPFMRCMNADVKPGDCRIGPEISGAP